ncbi:BglG family transcription antiterminator [Lacticaseibacillus baoqingensis]|uniref:BglG family transcription antiterminator n=1 Tax=Lacticaseibacillus baoqingensis TaxID=2486013 RepID=A0ABW4EBC8_9LACO|nr:transcription antiterminator [Lacticaseibacillus baoqingensis]
MAELSTRQKQVVKALVNAEVPLTAKALANSHNVSVRTMRYDLNTIRDWLGEHAASLASQPHKGIWITADTKQRQQLRLAVDDVQAASYLQPTARMTVLFLALVQTNEFMTMQQLQSCVDVSPTTLKNDLKKLRQYLAEQHLTLISKNYYGFKVAGDEVALRHLMAQILFAELSRKTLPAAIADALAQKRLPKQGVLLTRDTTLNHLFNTVLAQAIDLIVVHEQAPELEQLMTLLIRLTIAISRQSINKPLNSYQQLRPEEVAESFAGYLIARTYAYFELPLLSDDYHYILGTQLERADSQNMVATVRQMIAQISAQTQIDFTLDSQLQENLYLHLTNHRAGDEQLQSYNPFTDDIKAEYPELFAAIKRTSRQLLVDTPITDAFVSFVALHFMVSLQRRPQSTQNVRIAYVCATGLGITNLIQQRLAESISNIEIVGFAGLDTARQLIQKEAPDLVVSIFPLKGVKVPVVEVQPLPTPADIATIKAIVAKLLKLSPDALQPQAQPAPAQPQADLAGQVQQTVLKMFSIYSDLQAILPQKIAPDYADAFIMHVFLAVHRIMFNQQYQGVVANDPPKLVRQIESVFSRYGLAINRAECHAIIEYLNLTQTTEGGGMNARNH